MKAIFTVLLESLGLLLVLSVSLLAQNQVADQGTAVRQPRYSWTADRREFQVGDVLTVLIDEHARASANRTDAARDLRRRDMDLVVGGTGLAAIPGAGARVGTTNDADSRRDGDAFRQNRFQGEMSVQVIEVTETGLLRIEGKKLVRLDNDEQELTLSGLVRPQDVSAGNLVDSWRIAEADLVYRADGDLGKPRGGLLSRLLGWLWP